MSKKRIWFSLAIIIGICGFWGTFSNLRQVQGAMSEHNLVDGSPSIQSACIAPDDKKSGGYEDAVDYNDNICNGKSSTWNYKNGYIFWSTKSKVATKTKAKLFRSIGWNITFSADMNGDRRIDDSEKIMISVARTIKGDYYKKMNYYYIHYQQKEVDGVLYNYSLYAMSYDRLKELVKNYEASVKNGQTPTSTAIFSSDKIHIEIDAIMTIVERDEDGKEDIKGQITSENGTTALGTEANANGTITTDGDIYYCRNKKDYEYLSDNFNASSIATYKNSGVIANNKITISYYVDADKYGVSFADGWGVNKTSGQIYYKGKPYTQEYRFWEVAQVANLRDVMIGEGCTFTGTWRCFNLSCYVKDDEQYHTSYLSQFASFDPGASGIYSGDGTLKLYANTPLSWRTNSYTIEYYTKKSECAKNYEKVATQVCEYGKSYKFYSSENTIAPVLNGVSLKEWAIGTPESTNRVSAKAQFSDELFPEVQKKAGTVICLYAIWQVKSYTITCDENLPSGEKQHQFYEIYNVGFTTDKSLASLKTSSDPFSWIKSSKLLKSSEIILDNPKYDGYIWNGYWDKEKQVQFFDSDGKALFSSAQTFEKNTTIWGNWRKNHTLTILYQIGADVSISANTTGYGVDSDGYLTRNGKRVSEQYLATEEVNVLTVPDCIKKAGNTRPTKWQLKGTSEAVKGGGVYTARTLAKKVGEDIATKNVSIVMELPWSVYRYYVDYYFWNDKTASFEIYATQNCVYGGIYAFYSEQNATGVRIPKGKVFRGWSKSETSQTVAYKSGEKYTNLSTKSNGRVKLFGVWGGMTYQIQLNGNCPSNSDLPVEMTSTEIDYVYGQGFYQYGTSGELQSYCVIDTPICPGYVFIGYYSLQTGGTLMVDATGRSTSNLSYTALPTTLYAQWEKRTYQITYDANSGAFLPNTYGDSSQIRINGIAYGSFLPVPITPKKEGYSFDGYIYKKTQGDELWYNRFLSSANRKYNVSSDVTLYAAWVDDIVPTGTIKASAGNNVHAWTNQTVNIQITGLDSGSGVVKMQLFQKKYNENRYQMIGEWVSEPVKRLTQSLVVDANGISNFYCVIYDARGNTNYRIFGTDTDRCSIATTSIYIDKTPPRITPPDLGPAKLGDTEVSVSLYASDDVIE